MKSCGNKQAVGKTAADSLESINKFSNLHDKNLQKLPKTTRSKDNLRAVFDYIEQYPIIDIKRTAKELEVYVKKLVSKKYDEDTTE